MMSDNVPPQERDDQPQVMKKWPIFPTIFVAVAVITMVALGIWQWQRQGEKIALIALFERNMQMDEPVFYPAIPPVEPQFLYRKSSVNCLEVVRFSPRGGSDRAGKGGIRMIAECRTGSDGPGALVDLGIADDFGLPDWSGGTVAGWIAPGPEQPSMIEKLLGRDAPSRPLLVAEQPVAGLRPSAVPSAVDTPNNHFAYAMQWFFFAIAASIIFILAVRRRLRA